MFGHNFREDWCTNLKTKQKYQQVLRKETKSPPTTFSKNRPTFRRGPPASSYGRGGGGRAPQVFFVRTMPQRQRQHGKSNKITLPQHSTTSGCRQVKSSSFDQKPFPCQRETGPLAGRLKFYSENWEKLTQDVNILSIVQGFKIPFSQTPFQFGPPQLARVNQEERLQINSEIKEMLRKGAIQQVKSEPGEFLSNLFLVNKKDGGH